MNLYIITISASRNQLKISKNIKLAKLPQAVILKSIQKTRWQICVCTPGQVGQVHHSHTIHSEDRSASLSLAKDEGANEERRCCIIHLVHDNSILASECLTEGKEKKPCDCEWRHKREIGIPNLPLQTALHAMPSWPKLNWAKSEVQQKPNTIHACDIVIITRFHN
jgi:hypothetical protein